MGGGATVRGVIAFHCEQLSFVKLFTGRSMNLRYETDGGCIIMKTFNIGTSNSLFVMIRSFDIFQSKS